MSGTQNDQGSTAACGGVAGHSWAEHARVTTAAAERRRQRNEEDAWNYTRTHERWVWYGPS